MIGLKKNSHHVFIQSDVKPKPIVTRLHIFCQPQAFASIFDWFIVLSASFVTGYSDYSGFGFTTLNRPPLIYQYSNMAPKLSRQNCKFFKFLYCQTIPKADLDTKKTTPNIEVCPESLGAMLEIYRTWRIENCSTTDCATECANRTMIFPAFQQWRRVEVRVDKNTANVFFYLFKVKKH